MKVILQIVMNKTFWNFLIDFYKFGNAKKVTCSGHAIRLQGSRTPKKAASDFVAGLVVDLAIGVDVVAVAGAVVVKATRVWRVSGRLCCVGDRLLVLVVVVAAVVAVAVVWWGRECRKTWRALWWCGRWRSWRVRSCCGCCQDSRVRLQTATKTSDAMFVTCDVIRSDLNYFQVFIQFNSVSILSGKSGKHYFLVFTTEVRTDLETKLG